MWTQNWLDDYPWEMVVRLNEALCRNKSVLHKPSSDGYDAAQQLWESARGRPLPLERALMVAYECHALAPFCFFNGNTFVAVTRLAIEGVLAKLAAIDPDLAASFRSVTGHFVAGTEGMEELRDALGAVEKRLADS
jgi:hypothetical protein